MGGIPKTKKREEILSEMRKVTDGVVDVIVYPSAADKSKNRGFAFVEYESHRAAAMARRKLLPGTGQRPDGRLDNTCLFFQLSHVRIKDESVHHYLHLIDTCSTVWIIHTHVWREQDSNRKWVEQTGSC